MYPKQLLLWKILGKSPSFGLDVSLFIVLAGGGNLMVKDLG